jgi:nitrogen regulatory protein PII
MKEIKAYIRPALLDSVIDHLEGAGAKDLTVIRVDAIGAVADSEMDRLHMFKKYNQKYSNVSKLEIVCTDEEAGRYVETLRQYAHTGGRGDGRIFISEVENAVNIRTGEEGKGAL